MSTLRPPWQPRWFKFTSKHFSRVLCKTPDTVDISFILFSREGTTSPPPLPSPTLNSWFIRVNVLFYLPTFWFRQLFHKPSTRPVRNNKLVVRLNLFWWNRMRGSYLTMTLIYNFQLTEYLCKTPDPSKSWKTDQICKLLLRKTEKVGFIGLGILIQLLQLLFSFMCLIN